MALSLSHVGVCVSDLDRSTSFYNNVIGARTILTVNMGTDLPAKHRTLIEMPDDVCTISRFLDLDGRLIELLQYSSDAAASVHVGDATRRPMNKLGLTHLSFRTSDRERFDSILRETPRYGGTVLDESRIQMNFNGFDSDLIFILDPDGTRIEIMHALDEHVLGS